MHKATKPINNLEIKPFALKCSINNIIKAKRIKTTETNMINFVGNKFNFMI